MKIKIEGVPRFDGEYPCDAPYTAREWRLFKQIGGILPQELVGAMMGGDVDVILCYAVIGVRRRGLEVNEQVFLDYDPAKVFTLDLEDEADAVPPPSSGSVDDKPTSSGAPGNAAGDTHPESHQNGTGGQPSATGSASGLETSAT